MLLSWATETWAAMKRPNGLKHGGNPHGIELCTPAIVTVNMMLCMSVGDVIRVFRVWPKAMNARFADIRCHGAFLVSSAPEKGDVRFVRIHSERGTRCTVENPWPDREVRVHRDEGRGETIAGARLSLSTSAGETLLLGPTNVTADELRARVRRRVDVPTR